MREGEDRERERRERARGKGELWKDIYWRMARNVFM